MKHRVGRYIIADAMFIVYLDDATWDGSVDFNWRKEPDTFITMTIGTKDHTWTGISKLIVHEVMELAMRLFHTTWEPHFTRMQHESTGRFLFVANHEQFTMVCDHVADALVFLFPAVKKAWLRMKRKPKRNRKKRR